ncbi:MAG: glycerophosphodiester phosphodiesterase [Patescibacteria group bacterium]
MPYHLATTPCLFGASNVPSSAASVEAQDGVTGWAFWAILWPMLILAHRGFRVPGISENTVPAFQSAIENGADGVEFDLRLSKDDELVVVHDANLHRIAGDAHKIVELTADELSEITLRHGGTIPTLNDVTAQVHEPALLDMEVKTLDVTEDLIAKLKTSTGLRDRTIVSSFHAPILARVKTEVPDVRTLLLVARWPLPLRGSRFLRKIERLAPWGIAFRLPLLTHRRIRKLRDLGYKIGAWDNRGTRAEARRAVRMGLDFAILSRMPSGFSWKEK